jgi:type III pantothenate kinase
MLLTIDSGNTRTKWALFDAAGNMTWQGVCANKELEKAALLPPNTACLTAIIANVAGEQHAEMLCTLLNKFAIKNTHWAKATPRTGDVISSYDEPETLGIDRWASMIAAWHLQKKTCIVLSAGTAVTIDALVADSATNKQEALFVGGVILPGLNLMQQSLGIATAQLPQFDPRAKINPTATGHPLANALGTTTETCIYQGALCAIVGGLMQVVELLKPYTHQPPMIILSGGDATIIKAWLLKENHQQSVIDSVIIVDNLVLKGLFKLSNVMQSDMQ